MTKGGSAISASDQAEAVVAGPNGTVILAGITGGSWADEYAGEDDLLAVRCWAQLRPRHLPRLRDQPLVKVRPRPHQSRRVYVHRLPSSLRCPQFPLLLQHQLHRLHTICLRLPLPLTPTPASLT